MSEQPKPQSRLELALKSRLAWHQSLRISQPNWAGFEDPPMLIRSHSEELCLSIEGKGVNGLDFHVPSLPHIVDF